jgi:hypothetical protein
MRLPRQLPKRIADTYALAYVVHCISRGFTESAAVPRRTLQRELHRACGSGVSRCLTRLVCSDWLQSDEKHQIVRANSYRLGPLFEDVEVLREWQEWSRVVWALDSTLSQITRSPLSRHGSLNFSGVLVLQVLASSTRSSLTPKEVYALSAGLVSIRTIQKALLKVVRLGIVMKLEHGAYSIDGNWQRLLEDSTRGSWEEYRAHQIADATKRESERFQRMLNRGRLTSWERLGMVTGKRCAICAQAWAEEAHEFPPNSLRNPELSPLWFPACQQCNRRESRFLQLHPRDSYEWLGVLKGSSTLGEETTRLLMERYALAFNQALAAGDVRKANSIAGRAVILMGLKGNPATPVAYSFGVHGIESTSA